MAKNVQVHFRVSEEQRALLKSKADSFGMNLSEYLVFAAEAYLPSNEIIKSYFLGIQEKLALERFNLKDVYSSSQLTNKINVISEFLQQLEE